VTASSLRATPGGALRLRARDWVEITLLCAATAAVALGIATQLPDPGWFGLVVAAIGLPALAYLALSRRYGLTLTVFALYLGLLDGFLKLSSGVQAVSLGRDVVLAAACGGALARLMAERRLPRMPPLTPWVGGFAVIVVLQVFNPNTLSLTKGLAGVRQHLEWVPLFFFAYALLRSRLSLRNLTILICAIAAINGAVSLLQFQLTPDQMSAWGPGYREKVEGTDELSGRVFTDDAGNARVRPFALGSDMGFAGFVGVIAAPMLLALLATGSLAKRGWLVALLGSGIVAGIITSQSRSALIGAVVSVVAFVAIGAAGGRVWRSLGALAVVVALAWLLIPALTSQSEVGSFDRYASIAPSKVVDTAYSYRVDDNSALSHYVTEFPFGGGIGMTGPARAFGDAARPYETRNEGFNGETHFNYLAIELGVPGLLVFMAFQLLILWLVMTRLRRVPDAESRTYLAGMFAPCFMILAGGLGGPTMSAPPFAPWFWLTAGLAAYWLCRPRAAAPVSEPRRR
jgi:O-Antigen ligase